MSSVFLSYLRHWGWFLESRCSRRPQRSSKVWWKTKATQTKLLSLFPRHRWDSFWGLLDHFMRIPTHWRLCVFFLKRFVSSLVFLHFYGVAPQSSRLINIPLPWSSAFLYFSSCSEIKNNSSRVVLSLGRSVWVPLSGRKRTENEIKEGTNGADWTWI